MKNRALLNAQQAPLARLAEQVTLNNTSGSGVNNDSYRISY